ncbi:MAG TPA: hypothetical protein VFX97_04155 [Pyrinomonadaceae bacterium]|nr:hypothetical protein [Pyrinomonadaceae bacterium]
MAGLEHRRENYDGCDLHSLPNRVHELWLVPKKSYKIVPEKRATWVGKLREEVEAQSSLDAFARLDAAAKFKNVAVFLQEIKSIVWSNQSASHILRAVDLSLGIGAHVAARELATQGAQIHPENAELQKYARILAPARITDKRPTLDVKPKANIEWLKANRLTFKGKWVALKSGVLVGAADSRQALTDQVGETKGTGILLTLV